MRLRNLAITVAAAVLLTTGVTSAQIRVVNYNVAQLGGEDDELALVLSMIQDDDHSGFSVPVSVFLFQEVTTETLVFLQGQLSGEYLQATYTSSGEDSWGGAQAMFYRATQLQEIPSGHRDIFTGAGRRTDRWQLRLLGYSDPQIDLYTYSSHLRAGNGSSERADRLFGAQEILEDVATLPLDARVIVSGDMNLSSNGEDAYEAFVSGGLADPLGTESWSGAQNAIKHSQSPRASGVGGLAGGGLDDRFDFQLTTPGLLDGGGLAVIDGTYRSVGNDGDHYDASINDGTNSYWPGDIPRSNMLADALFKASDHIPVACDYQIPAHLASAMSSTWGPIIVGGETPVVGVLANDAPVFVTEGADECFFAAAGSGAFSGTDSGVLYALEPAYTIDLSASAQTPGSHSGILTVVTIAEDVPEELTLTSTGTVLDHSNASFSASSDVDSTTVHVPVEPDQGTVEFDVLVYNHGFFEYQARLDLDTIVGVEDPIELLTPLETGVGASPAVMRFGIDTQGLDGGAALHLRLTLHVSDEDLPGETTDTIVLDLEVSVKGETSCIGDVTGDQQVTIADLLAVIDAWGVCDSCAADINGDGTVSIADLLLVIDYWGPCP